ncbi:MAG: Nitroreductase [candidate division CPR2 bacterium GW2011_GWC1_39_9]|uniref:Nitroreductase n=1 Tax=candidate division CPR2 bacterium GW2011_GWC2_39_10 TaxID=1618345 RepID=A0A0G0M0Y4_UNCC2|nr:MAG: Nitroreductase [candidate division CPR2 bacterium GW2011_GWC2_39_10]KKR34673.1 MAG: Nitroreductase [candidate division CPR2 bacterium GW2011_GWC1_39_9]
MNETIKNILNRKSINIFQDKPIAKEDLDLLLKAAMAAPTGSDLRPWRFIVVTDKKMLIKISEALKSTEKIKGNSAAILICGDSSKSERFWTFDCSLAAENIMIAAQSIGIGSHWISIRPNKERTDNIKEIFNFPDSIKPLCAIALGYSDQDTVPKDKFDYANVHWEKW